MSNEFHPTQHESMWREILFKTVTYRISNQFTQLSLRYVKAEAYIDSVSQHMVATLEAAVLADGRKELGDIVTYPRTWWDHAKQTFKRWGMANKLHWLVKGVTWGTESHAQTVYHYQTFPNLKTLDQYFDWRTAREPEGRKIGRIGTEKCGANEGNYGPF